MMKELLNEWRKFLKEDDEAFGLPKDPNAVSLGEPSYEEALEASRKQSLNDFYAARENYWKMHPSSGSEIWSTKDLTPMTNKQKLLLSLMNERDKALKDNNKEAIERIERAISQNLNGVQPLEMWDLFNSLGGALMPSSPFGNVKSKDIKIDRPTPVKQSFASTWPGYQGMGIRTIPGLNTGKPIKYIQQGYSSFPVKKISGPIKVYHVSNNPNLDINDISFEARSGTRQTKKGKQYGGFYVADWPTAKNSYVGKYGDNIYEIEIKPETSIVDVRTGRNKEDLMTGTRLSANTIQNYLSNGAQIVFGVDGPAAYQFAILTPSVIQSIRKLPPSMSIHK